MSPETMTLRDGTEVESLESFRARARAYIQEHIPLATSGGGMLGQQSDEEELADVAHQRVLQRLLFDGGLAGIIVPRRIRRPGPDPRALPDPQ